MSDANRTSHSPLARYALALYDRNGVAPACLDLQDRFGLDVGLILMCCWAGRYGVRLDDIALRHAQRASAPWRETVVEPLRGLRRRLKSAVGGIMEESAHPARSAIQTAEIEAELVLLDHLHALAAHLPGTDGRSADRGGMIRGNILRYAALCGVSSDDLPRTGLEAIVSAGRAVSDKE